MPSFGKRVDGLRGRRASNRQSVVLAASAFSTFHSRSVMVADLTPEGARLHGRDLPPVGREVLIKVGSLDSFATVVWSEADRCGVRFDRAFAGDQMRALEQEGNWASVTGCVA